ncbi:MAG TPA: hypothetical protein VKS82_07490 [Streptosporangiaceae bacterium]|nr:hypothetical protein [Streptosporangiaceae bacterium]
MSGSGGQRKTMDGGVPHGQLGFDMLDHTGESRTAVQRAFGTVAAHLT